MGSGLDCAWEERGCGSGRPLNVSDLLLAPGTDGLGDIQVLGWQIWSPSHLHH